MKLINADEAFRVLSDYYHHGTETQADALREALELVPEAVVRCKDCRYNYGNAEGREYNPNDIVCTYFDTDGMDASDYCSYGERRTDES